MLQSFFTTWPLIIHVSMLQNVCFLCGCVDLYILSWNLKYLFASIVHDIRFVAANMRKISFEQRLDESLFVVINKSMIALRWQFDFPLK